MRGSGREDGRLRGSTDNKCAGLFLGFRFVALNFQKRKEGGTEDHLRIADVSLISYSNKTGKNVRRALSSLGRIVRMH